MGLWDALARVAAPPPRGRLVPHHAARAALVVGLAALTYFLFPSSPAVDVPMPAIGSVAHTTVIAPFAFVVRKDPEQLADEREAAADASPMVFVRTPATADTAIRALGQIAAAATRAASERDLVARAGAIVAAAESIGVRLGSREAEYLATSLRRADMLDAVDRAFRRWLPGGVAPMGALDSATGIVRLRDNARERSVRVDSVLTLGAFLARAQIFRPPPQSEMSDAVYTALLTALFRPTIVYDSIRTEAARDTLRRSVRDVKAEVLANENIIRANDRVGPAEYEKLAALRAALQERRQVEGNFGRVVGAVLFNALVCALLGVTILLVRPSLYRSLRGLTLVAVVFGMVMIAAALVARTEVPKPELIPVAMASILLSILYDARLSAISVMILAVLIGGQSVFRGTNALFLNLVGGIVAAYSVRVIRPRDQAYYSVVMTAAAYALAALAIGLTLGQPAAEIASSAAWGALNATLSVTVAMQMLLPLAEDFTGIDTYPRLLEWSDLNRPLMRRLSLEAPGTYVHTMAIATLAEAACAAIGADGLLGRVGAYYHDIGKLRKPLYFVENQQRGLNPHDFLDPAASAAIIRNHVVAGLDLAEEHHLPKTVRAFITEHHGTGAITYFLDKARMEGDPLVEVPDDFAYPGPLPQTAETAIVMLADGVEAAARVLSDPTPQQIRDVVDHIVRQRVEQGQLRHAPLTLAQLETIKEEFARVLVSMHHNRIDYPRSSGGVTAEFTAS